MKEFPSLIQGNMIIVDYMNNFDELVDHYDVIEDPTLNLSSL